MANNPLRPLAKRVIKSSLKGTRKVISKNKILKKGALLIRDAIVSDTTSQFYDYSKYAPTIATYQKQVIEANLYANQPLISIVMPTYNTDSVFLRECIDSVIIQSYSNWELCIADDASPNKDVVKAIKEYSKQDKRIKLVERGNNGHISLATNSAIEIAAGEYIALLDHDDVLWPNALFEIVKVINEEPETDFIYTDEDKINEDGKTHSYPFLKPDWSPEFLESCNYITHFSCIRASVLREVGGFRKGYEGAQDWDLFLRVSEKTQRICHIPQILYSWRIHAASTASDTDAKPYVYEAQRKLLVDHVSRSKYSGGIKQGIIKQHSCVMYDPPKAAKVSIVVLAKGDEDTKRCLKSINKYTNYHELEIVIVNPSRKIEILAKKLYETAKVVSPVETHNRAAQYNAGIDAASGEYLCFVEGNYLMNTANWIPLLMGDAQRDGIGIVSGKTLALDRDRFLGAAIGMGVYGLYAPLLEWMPVDDVHYMRGLYGQSRRNVSAIDSGCFMVSKKSLSLVGKMDVKMSDMCVVDLCLRLLKASMRNVYNPYFSTVDLHNTTAGQANKLRNPEAVKYFEHAWRPLIENDPYLNPSFTRTNGQLGVQ